MKGDRRRIIRRLISKEDIGLFLEFKEYNSREEDEISSKGIKSANFLHISEHCKEKVAEAMKTVIVKHPRSGNSLMQSMMSL